MKFYKGLYIGESVKDPDKVKRKLKRHEGSNIHVICIATGNDQLEIFHSAYLKQKYYRKNPPIIVGIASDYKEAVDIVVRITEESLYETGNCDLKEYLKIRAQKLSQK
ncbi:MAG: hypothetical protein IKY23_05845 [Lachnospiraceae bacterium]|nr:hypothetical protein [Lachnospiraceae bacterium]